MFGCGESATGEIVLDSFMWSACQDVLTANCLWSLVLFCLALLLCWFLANWSRSEAKSFSLISTTVYDPQWWCWWSTARFVRGESTELGLCQRGWMKPKSDPKSKLRSMWVIWHGGEFQEGKLTHDHVIFLLPVLMFRCKMISELDVKWFPNVFWAWLPSAIALLAKGHVCVRAQEWEN